MSLVELNLPPDPTLPNDVRAFLDEAGRRVERFQWERSRPAFVPSDFAAAYAGLRALEGANAAPGRSFCEWGSGFGVAACLAAFLGFDACGIETEAELVEAARRLADDFGLPVQFARGNFIPSGASLLGRGLRPRPNGGRFAWLETGGPCGYAALGLDPDDFDVIYVYPWPDEEDWTARLFQRHARGGAVLATYHGGDGLRFRKKTGKRRRP